MKSFKVKDIIALAIIISTLVTEFSINIIGIPLIGVWLLLALNDNKYTFCDYFFSSKKIVILNYAWITVSVILYAFKNKFMTSYEIKNIFRIAMNLLIFGYYLYYGNKNTLKFFLKTSLVIILLLSVNTTIALIQNPNLSRILSTANPEKYEGYIEKKFIGSFGFAYGLVFIIFSITGCKFGKEKIINKIIYGILCLVFITTIIYEQFMMSILLLIISIILIKFKIYNIKRIFIFMIATICIMLMIMPMIINILEYTAQNIKQYELSQRIYEIINLLENTSLEKSRDMKSRVDKNLLSINTFINDPLGLTDEKEIGEHSELLDEYAKYGLVIASLTVSVFVTYMNFIKKDILKQEKTRRVWFLNGIIYLIYSIVNTSMFMITTMMIFFIVPLILKTSERDESNERIMDS